MTDVELHHGAASDVGLVREVNEDAFLVAPPVFVVADGMGGHDRGDVAARIVVEEFAALAESGYDHLHGPEAVTATLRSCQARIAAYDEQQWETDPDFSAGTTVVVALVVEQAGTTPGGGSELMWLLANVGDSRAYRFNDAVLEQVSVDHSVVQELLDDGSITPDAAATHPHRHVITRALSGDGSVGADFFVLPLARAERLLLCSDGVSAMIGDDLIADILGRTSDPRDAADRLVAAALAAGGRDNATALVVDVVGLVPDRPYDSDAQRMSLEQKLGALP